MTERLECDVVADKDEKCRHNGERCGDSSVSDVDKPRKEVERNEQDCLQQRVEDRRNKSRAESRENRLEHHSFRGDKSEAIGRLHS
jgi:hypothetical protein